MCSIGSKHTESVTDLETREENSNSQGSLKNLEHQVKTQKLTALVGVIWLPGNDPASPVGEINPKGTTGRRWPNYWEESQVYKRWWEQAMKTQIAEELRLSDFDYESKSETVQKRNGENALLKISVLMWKRDQSSKFQMKEEPLGSLCHHSTASWNWWNIEKGGNSDIKKVCAEYESDDKKVDFAWTFNLLPLLTTCSFHNDFLLNGLLLF